MTVFVKDGEILSERELFQTVRTVPAARSKLRTAETERDIANVFGFVGGALVGYPFGTMIAGGEPNWVLSVAGSAFLMVGIPMALSYPDKLKGVIKTYNRRVGELSYRAAEIRMGLVRNGIGVEVRF